MFSSSSVPTIASQVICWPGRVKPSPSPHSHLRKQNHTVEPSQMHGILSIIVVLSHQILGAELKGSNVLPLLKQNFAQQKVNTNS